MKSPLLVFLIVFNMLTANLAVAYNMHDEQIGDSHLVQSSDEPALASCIDESACDHHCHFSSHMTGLLTSIIALSPTNFSMSFDIRSDHLFSVDLGRLKRPPQA